MVENLTSKPQLRGRIRASILIGSFVIIVIFVVIATMQFYRPGLISSGVKGSDVGTNTFVEVATNTESSGIATDTSSLIPPMDVTAAPPQPPISISHGFGIAAGGGLSKLTPTELNQQLDQMVALGATWVRFDIEWGNVQYNSPNTSNWANYDTLVSAIIAHHMKALGIIVFTPTWARVAGCGGGVECPPRDPALFATFAAQVAARYKNEGLHYWEIWNEPNSYNFWATKTDCKAYTQLLKAVYPSIKKVDPRAVIITGGLAPAKTNDVNISPTDFLNCIYANGGKNYFDAVGDHPYSYPQTPSQVTVGAWAQMALTSPSLRSIMVANGDQNKKIWLTEYGTPTNGPDSHWYVSEASQSQLAQDAIGLYKSYPWAGPLFWYSLKDSGSTPDNNENFFGLVRHDGSLKPAYSTLKELISAGL